ncbi:MBL fold metallo-hydrolase [Pseudooceanicola sp. 200-1SW]|uniref:MBL fold metallo-hydrolase n=1 Tax=Pseudooceanicola sp. 200-1SW TaxID=3425949 RepID=UPI003D7F6EC9
MQITVIGAAGGYPYGGHACSSFLVESRGQSLLLDAGPGVALRVLGRGPAIQLDGIAISHCHPDHVLDLIPLGYALMTEWISTRSLRRVPLALPEGGTAFLQSLSALFGHKHWRFTEDDCGPGFDRLRDTAAAGQDWLFEVFEIHEFTASDSFDIAGLSLATCAVDHMPGAVALRLSDGDKTLVYTGDTRWTDALPPFAADCDLLIADAHFSGSEPPGGAHMSPAEAARLAKAARARALMLTHLAAPSDAEAALASARAACDVPVCLALTTDAVTL